MALVHNFYATDPKNIGHFEIRMKSPTCGPAAKNYWHSNNDDKKSDPIEKSFFTSRKTGLLSDVKAKLFYYVKLHDDNTVIFFNIFSKKYLGFMAGE